MDTAAEVVLLLLSLATIALVYWLKVSLPTYLTEKAKNLATKQDISDITTEIETVKTEFRRVAFEHEVRFSKLHQRRAEVIEEIYKKLVVLTWHATNLANPFQFVGDKPKLDTSFDLQNAIADCYRYLDQHRIFLPDKLGQPLEDIMKQTRPHAILLGTYLQEEYPTEGTKQETEKARQELEKFVQQEVPKMMESLRNEFRGLLGETASGELDQMSETKRSGP